MRSYLPGDLSSAGADIEKYLSEAHGGIAETYPASLFLVRGKSLSEISTA